MMDDSKKKPKTKRWVFPLKRCPHCRGYKTYATHTDSERGIQSRRCRAAICRHVRFTVRGVPTEENPKSEIRNPKLLCPHCGKDYQRQADLTKHINRNHKKGETHDGERTED